jgi:hypothetical protein
LGRFRVSFGILLSTAVRSYILELSSAIAQLSQDRL